jgi:hypothetical protein
LEQLARASAQVTPMEGYYLVQFESLIYPHNHLIRKDRTCACSLGADCPAVTTVADYLRNGGTRAPDIPAHRLIPEVCPVCGGEVKFEPRLCSRTRGAGWVCLSAAEQEQSALPESLRIPGHTHYWQFKWTELFSRRKELQA